MNELINYLLTNETISHFLVLALAEIIARLVPTSRDISIINFLARVLNAVPNNAKTETSNEKAKFKLKSIFVKR